jgi:hypothetical protein
MGDEEEELTLEVGGKIVGFCKSRIETPKSLTEELAESAAEASKSAHDTFLYIVKTKIKDGALDIDELKSSASQKHRLTITSDSLKAELLKAGLKTDDGYWWYSEDARLPIFQPFDCINDSQRYWAFIYWYGRKPVPKDFKQYAYFNFERIAMEMLYHKGKMEKAKSEGFKRHHARRLESLEKTYKFRMI